CVGFLILCIWIDKIFEKPKHLGLPLVVIPQT
ncbi:MAG: hypothetical protein ACI91Z_000812, partial [Yoonia sp.]